MVIDNRDQINMVHFNTKGRKAFKEFALVLIRSLAEKSGSITFKVKSHRLKDSGIRITS